MPSDTVAIAADHAGFQLKSALKEELARMGRETLDLGTSSEEAVDYPDFADRLADTLARGHAKFGVLMCGSGIGMSIAANRNPAVRAALCTTPEMARLARLHNDANVLVLGGRITPQDTAKQCLHAFLETPFEGGRHARRVAKLSKQNVNVMEGR
jgi:ribose 5-phosphate isomerase B